MPSWRDKAYPIPSPIDPGATRCIKVYVPDNPVYLGDFWLAYEFFTSWLAWPKGGTTAKEVAAIWKTAFDQAREEYENGEGCSDMDVRQKPLEPCTLQKLVNGVWVDFADLTLCMNSQHLPGPLPESAGSPTLAWLALMAWLIRWVRGIIDDIGDNVPRDDIIDNTITLITDHAPGMPAPRQEVAALVDHLTGLTEAERAAYYDECRYTTLAEDLATVFDQTGSFLGAWPTPVSDWFDDTNLVGMALIENILAYLSPDTTLRDIIDYWGNVEGVGTIGDNCYWEIDWDFTTTDGGLTPNENPWDNLPMGAYSDAWHPSNVKASGGGVDRVGRLQAKREAGRLVHCASIEMWFDSSPNTAHDFTAIEYYDAGNVLRLGAYSTNLNDTYLSMGTLDITGIAIFMEGKHLPGGDNDAETGGKVTRLRMTGTGISPF